MEEDPLIHAARQGDREAYASLVRQHSRAVFGLCVGMLGDTHRAEDAAQEAFVKGFLQLSSLREHSRFLPWIATIARNGCIDFLRREKRARVALADHPARRTQPVERGHEAETAERESRERLQGMIARLPEKYRLPLVLYYFDGERTENVAEALGLDPAGVATRLSRARRMLRKLLEEQGDEP